MTIYHAKRNYDVPNIDLLSLLFDSPYCIAQEDTVIHINADDPSKFITKSEARTLVKRTAAGLRRLGIGASGPGKDVVVVVSSGQIMLPILFYAVIAAGGVYSAASASSTRGELARQIRQGNSNLIFCSEDTSEVAGNAADDVSVSRDRVYTLDSNLRNMFGFGRHLKLIPEDSKEELDWEKIHDQKTLEDRLICLLYSSGTTGDPKGVLISHRNIVAEVVIPVSMTREYLAEREAAGDPPFQLRTLAHLPAAHIAGVQGYFINPFYQGGPVYWMPKFDWLKFLEHNKKYKITYFFTVPPIYLLIAKSPLVTDQFDNLKIAISGAAPLGKELQTAASAKLGKGQTFISQTWGLSETTGSVTGMPWGEKDDTGSVSPLLPNMSIRLVDDDGKDVEPGKPGEVLVKGPVVSKGYYNNSSATTSAFTKDGWFCTGDIAEFRNGMFYIVDRKKELIKYKGLQVAPAELEALLISHPKILDAAVIGVPGTGDSEGTEVPRAYLTPAVKVSDHHKTGEPQGVTKEDIIKFVKDNVAGYKQLRGGIVWMDVIPKSPSGKILRKELRALAAKEYAGRVSRL